MTLEKARDRIRQLVQDNKILLEPYLDPNEPDAHLTDNVMAVDTVIRLLDQLVAAGYSTVDEVIKNIRKHEEEFSNE